MDDTDLKLSPAERSQAWELLRALAAGGTTVLAVCSEAPEDALTVHTRPAAGAARPAGGTTTEKETADAIAETGRA